MDPTENSAVVVEDVEANTYKARDTEGYGVLRGDRIHEG